jgi:hypothetical protein
VAFVKDKLFGKPKTLDDQILSLEDMARQDAEKLAKVQRIAALQAQHKTAKKRIAAFRKTPSYMYGVIFVLGVVLLILVMKGCK